MRLSLMYEARLERDREAFLLAEAAREGTLADYQVPEDEEEMPVLPHLDQVRGWSKADPANAPHNPDLALFGESWLKDWVRRGEGPD